MFKYNEISDLIDGSLVTPLSIEDDGTILCLNKNNEKKYYTFDDFDFNKKPENRKPIESAPEPEEPEEDKKDPTVNDVIDEMQKDEDDSIFDGTDDDVDLIPDPEDPEEPEPIEEDEEGFLSPEESYEVVKTSGLVDERFNHKVWKDIVKL